MIAAILRALFGGLIEWLEKRRAADKARADLIEKGAVQERVEANAHADKIEQAVAQASGDAPKTKSEVSEKLRRGEF